MRLVTVLSLLLMVGLVAGSALADKYEPNEKQWSLPQNPLATQVAEQEPNDTCPGQGINCGDQVAPASYAATTDDDWYQFYATAGTIVTIATNSWNGSDVDTYLQLYGSDCATLLTSDDDGGPSFFSLISNYLITVDGYYNIKTYTYNHSYTGEYQLTVVCNSPNPPDPNDTCNPNYAIDRCTQGVLNGDMTWDANNYDPLSGGCATGFAEAGLDVVYMMNLNAGDVVDMTYTTPNWDAAFYVITDCANPAGSCVIGADSGYDVESINWTVGGTGTYWLVLDHYGTGTGAGPWSLDYSIVCVGATGACCDPANGDCTVTTPGDCHFNYQGDGTDCTPNLCPVPFPVQQSSWGQIKAQYR